jgi:uncharacterized protein (DUF342 family)
MLGNEAAGVFLDVREDGIYLIIDNKRQKDQSIRSNPLKLLQGTGITDFDAAALSNAFNSREERVEAKIAIDTRLAIVNETVKLELDKDAMEVKLTFNPGHEFFGETMDHDDIMQALKDQGVVYGILTDVVKEMSLNRPPVGKPVVVALGVPPVAGGDGALKFAFDVEAQGNKPKILDDGSVDYKDVNYVLKAVKDELLVEAMESTPGTDGINVRGARMPHKPGKPSPRLPRGKNTYITEDGTKLFAEISGQIQVEGGRVNVNPILLISGDVGNETGNLDFTGTIIVEGTVQPGFSVKATEGVDVKGAVEGAYIESGGDIALFGGVKGTGKAVIKAGGDIFARYVERATLVAGGDITSDSIMHSHIRCKKDLNLIGKNGLLVGGQVYVGKSLSAKTIGSSMATVTEITVGNSPEYLEQYHELEETYKKAKTEYDKEKLVESYRAGNEDLRLRSLQARIHLRVEMDRIQKEMNELLLILNSKDGVIRASQVIHPGCKIIVGGVLMKVTDDLHACTLRNVDEKVHIGVYINYDRPE